MTHQTPGYDWNVSAVFENGSNHSQVFEEETLDQMLDELRKLYIRAYYGEHYHLIFLVCFVVCVIGYITNFLNVVVFSRTSLSNPMNLFLLVLSVTDIALITTQFAHSVHYFLGFKMYPFYSHYIFQIVGTFFESIFITVSNWMVTVVGVWRHLVVTWPNKCSRWFTEKRMKIVILLILVFSIVLAAPMFLLFTYETFQLEGLDVYNKDFTEFAKYHDKLPLKIYWGLLILRGLVPMIVMAVATGGLIWSLCKSRPLSEKGSRYYMGSVRITIMLLLLLVLFLLSNLPDSLMFLVSVISGGDNELREKLDSATNIIRVFMLANNSFSFFIYYCLGQEFRGAFQTVFCRGTKKNFKNPSGTETDAVLPHTNW